jgi:hypothetical protein
VDFWEAVVLIVVVVTIGRVMAGGRWNRRERRWERYSTENPYVRAGQADDQRREIERINARLATLEKLVTDPSRRLADEIEQLRR